MTISNVRTYEDAGAPIELVPNPVRVYGEHTFDNSFAILITVQCVARWADRCAIWPVGHPGDAGYEGPLPDELSEREALITQAWTDVRHWLDHDPVFVGYLLEAALLWRGEFVMLDMHDAGWGLLYLTAEQAATLQQWWADHRIPTDLYIPAARKRSGSDHFGRPEPDA